MAVNAQSILETIHENAQKNVLTNKVKRAAVPGLSMFGILWYSLVFLRWKLPRPRCRHP